MYRVMLADDEPIAVSYTHLQEEPEVTELTFIHGWGGTVKTHSTMQEIYRAFDEENPDIVLNYQPSSDSNIAVEQANNMLAIDKMPDIVSTNGQSYYVQNAVKRGMALDLSLIHI